MIGRTTPNGTGVYRYGTDTDGSEDGYGDCFDPDPTTCSPTGAPWPPTDQGSGHLWPVLAGERGEFNVADGNRAGATLFLNAMAGMTSGRYLEPEQAWENPAVAPSPFGTDPVTASIGFKPGQPVGSASPLTWSESQYARLALAIGAGRDLDTPAGRQGPLRHARHARERCRSRSRSPAHGADGDRLAVTISGTTIARARGRRRGVAGDGRHGGHRLDDGRRLAGNWSAVAAGRLRHDDDHRDGDDGPQHRLRADVRRQPDAARNDRTRPSPTRPAMTTGPARTRTRRAATSSPGRST